MTTGHLPPPSRRLERSRATELLPAAAAEALADPPPPLEVTVPAAGLDFRARIWGEGAPLLLLHGITASSRTWWRVGPALAASGRRVIAPDLPGHGQTTGRGPDARFLPTARLLARFAEAAGLSSAGPSAPEVVGHSWGAMIAAALPAAGLLPRRLVLLDPPVVAGSTAETWAAGSQGRFRGSLDAAVAAIRAENPDWAEEDVVAKAEAVSLFDEEWALDVVIDNGDWDGGLAALLDPAGRGVPTIVIRGEPGLGGLLPDSALPGFEEALGGRDRIRTLAGAEHSPQRTHPVELVVALLAALTDPL